ncbi:MAG: hypothetical protein AAB354_14420 [candidate division KSB1 bacterium]
MSHTLVLSVPHEIYLPLLKSAERDEQTPEELAVLWLKNTVQQMEVENDPLEKFIGAWQSNFPNWSSQHDQLLGEELARQLQGNPTSK